MKFLLIITMCSSIYANCMPPVQVEEIYDSHYDCALDGYNLSADIIENLKPNKVNADRIYLSFACKPMESS